MYETRVKEYLAEQEALAIDESAGVDDDVVGSQHKKEATISPDKKAGSVDNNKAVTKEEKPIDDLSVLVGIGREVLFLLKCIVGLLLCLVILVVVHICM